MTEEMVRKLYGIPYKILDPNPDPIIALPPIEDDDASKADDDAASSMGGEETEDDKPKKQKSKKAKPIKQKKKTIDVPIPEGLVGDVVALLLEHEEIKELAKKRQKPFNTLLQSADDWVRLKVGPVKYTDALEVAPYS